MNINPLLAISPLDGRYASKVAILHTIFSEFGLIKYRVIVEISWLKHLYQQGLIEEGPIDFTPLDQLMDKFALEHAEAIKTIEHTTNHDVKAVEYFLQTYCAPYKDLAALKSYWHFACTSEDINNLAYALMLKTGLESVLFPLGHELIENLQKKAHAYSDVAMLARTHGQSATPTTLGKEFAVFVARLRAQLNSISKVELLGKCNGAVGNFNAHFIAYPEVNWPKLVENFVNNLGLTYNPYVTQIESHDFLAAVFHGCMRFNTILLDLARDFWTYISQGYFTQKLKANEVGSSTMPHKVNPIDFENAEGNLGLANAVFEHMANKLPISRLQRDLSDSTVLRNIGVAFGYTLIALDALTKGLNKLELDPKHIAQDLETHWEVLAEAVQTVMRRYAIDDAYEQLKTLTRGHGLSKSVYQNFVHSLNIPSDAKTRLLELNPSRYLGLAAKLAKEV